MFYRSIHIALFAVLQKSVSETVYSFTRFVSMYVKLHHLSRTVHKPRSRPRNWWGQVLISSTDHQLIFIFMLKYVLLRCRILKRPHAPKVERKLNELNTNEYSLSPTRWLVHFKTMPAKYVTRSAKLGPLTVQVCNH